MGLSTTGMTRTEKRAYIRECRAHLAKHNKRWPTELADVPCDETDGIVPPEGCFRVMRSTGFLVQFHKEPGDVIRLSVQRTAIDDEGEWVDGITWDDLQALKRQAGFGERDAIEVYPRDVDMVNVASIRHLWVLPVGHALTPFVWRR